MDLARGWSQEGKPELGAPKSHSRLFETGLSVGLDEAALLLYALSFGPLSKGDLVRSLKQAGITMPGGFPITIQRAGECIQRLRKKGQITSQFSEPPKCPPEVRVACLEAARAKGWLSHFARALQESVPGQVSSSDWEYRWGRRRFVSLAHACRDVFIALEKDDQDELKRLAGLCSQDLETRSLTDVLLLVCIDPFQPKYIERLPAQYWGTVLTAAAFLHVCSLTLDHPVFAYLRTRLRADRHCLDRSLLERCVTLLTQRDLLAGDFAGAQSLLDAFADLNLSLIRGMLEVFRGQVPEARQTFEAARRNVGKGKTAQSEHFATFPGLLHALLLVQSEQLQDRQQIRGWLNGQALSRGSGANYREAYRKLEALLAWYEGHPSTGPETAWHPAYHGGESPLTLVSTFLAQLLYWFYSSNSKPLKSHQQTLLPLVENLLKGCDEHGARWPVMQIARLLSRLGVALPPYVDQAEAFFRETGAKDLSELWPVKEVWENRVGALEQLLRQEADRTNNAAAEASIRLGWKLCEYGQDRITVIPVEQKRTKNGGWTKGREIALYRLASYADQNLDHLTEQDKAALAGILGKQHHYYEMAYQLDAGVALNALAGHPNVFWQDRPHMPVEIVRGTPEVRIEPKGSRLCISMDPHPQPGTTGTKACVTKESPTRVRVVAFEPVHLKMAEILGPGGVTIPKDRSQEALNRLEGISRHVAIQSDVALAGTQAESVEPDCRPHLRLQRLDRGLQAEMVVVPLGGQSQRAFTPGVGNPHLVESIADKALQTRRDLPQETEWAERALEAVPLLDDFTGADYTWVFDDPQEALELLAQLQTVPPEVLTVEWPKGDPITVRSISAQQLRLSIHSAQDWFEVEGNVQVDQDLVIKMRTLLDQIEKGDGSFIALGKDQYIALSRQLRKQLQWLGAGGQYVGKGDTLRMHPLAALGLEQWKDEIGELRTDTVFDAHLERLRAVESYQPVLPSTLQATLRPYQQDGFTWLARLAEWGVGACLADDMGLGKTIEALALILHRASQGPTLVAAPTSVCANWVSEAQRFAPTLRPIRFGIGDLGRREQVLKALGPFDLLICSYTLLQQEAEALKDTSFATIVLDEAQAIKNAATKRSSAAMGLTGGFRMICTGTPIENRLAELWNLFRFINPGLLGSEDRFHERFVRPIEINRDPHASHILKSLVQPFILRRTKSQVLEDLPPRTETMRLVELSPEEQALHESLRQRALERLEGMRDMAAGQAHIHVLAELMKLRRCCCNPRLVVPNCGLTGSKLEAFAELVDELRENQHKALVFSQFVDHLTLLREHLDKQGIRYQYLDGSTPAKTRQKRIDAFQNGEGDLFLISLKAGGLGLNLTAADYVIHMDPWWNPAVEDQASDRAHRIGQTRPVTIYRLVAADTIEEKIVQLHHAKRDLADSLLAGTDTAHTLTANELIDLLRNR